MNPQGRMFSNEVLPHYVASDCAGEVRVRFARWLGITSPLASWLALSSLMLFGDRLNILKATGSKQDLLAQAADMTKSRRLTVEQPQSPPTRKRRSGHIQPVAVVVAYSKSCACTAGFPMGL